MRVKQLISGLAITAFFALASSMERQDEAQQEERYCQMVQDGSWGDYREDVNCDVKIKTLK